MMTSVDDQQTAVEQLRADLLEKVSGLKTHLERLLTTVQMNEKVLEGRLADVEARVKARVQVLSDESSGTSRTWSYAFAALVRAHDWSALVLCMFSLHMMSSRALVALVPIGRRRHACPSAGAASGCGHRLHVRQVPHACEEDAPAVACLSRRFGMNDVMLRSETSSNRTREPCCAFEQQALLGRFLRVKYRPLPPHPLPSSPGARYPLPAVVLLSVERCRTTER
jgi:hypothetical protein